MALKATIFKLELQVDDIDRHYYQTHTLTIARHPSENNERMLYRIIAFALNAHNLGSRMKSDCAKRVAWHVRC